MSTNPTDSLINCELIAEAGETDRVLMILTVRTIDGLELKHSYPIPSGYEGCLTQWHEALGAIHAALEAKGPLVLNNPPAVYNGAHIASVEFSFVGAAKIIERINNAHRGMGFRFEAAPAAEVGVS